MIEIQLWQLLTASAACFLAGFGIGYKLKPQITENKVHCDIANKSGKWRGMAPQPTLVFSNGKCVSAACFHISGKICDLTKEKCKFI